MEKLKFYKSKENQDVKNKGKQDKKLEKTNGQSYAQVSLSNIKRNHKYKWQLSKSFIQENSGSLKSYIQDKIQKSRINMTTKGSSRRQILVSISSDNVN